MKSITQILVLLFLHFGLFAQSAKVYHELGVEKAAKRDYLGAIKEYDKAIKADTMLLEAWSDRAAAKFAIKDYKGSILDYTYIIIKNPKDENAIFNHAVCWAAMKRNTDAIISINHLLEINPNSGSAYLFRAQMQYSLGIKDTACMDFQKAYDLHEPGAGYFLNAICKRKDVIREDLVFPWNEEENWVGVTRENNEKQLFREFVKKGESMESFTVASTEVIYKEIKVPLKSFMQKIIQENKKICPDSHITLVKDDSLGPNPFIIFFIECPGYNNSSKSQSQLVKIINGKVNTYLMAILSPDAKLSDGFLAQWLKFLQMGKIEER
jgi:tetratricopeptide (TPR) repeat protein